MNEVSNFFSELLLGSIRLRRLDSQNQCLDKRKEAWEILNIYDKTKKITKQNARIILKYDYGFQYFLWKNFDKKSKQASCL